MASLTAYKRCGTEENKLCLVSIALLVREFDGLSSVCEILRGLSKINICGSWLAYPVWCLHQIISLKILTSNMKIQKMNFIALELNMWIVLSTTIFRTARMTATITSNKYHKCTPEG